MSTQLAKLPEGRDRIDRVLHVAFVVACYLVVFAGLLYSVAAGAGAP